MKLIQDIKYTVKSVRSIFSGFDRLEYRAADGDFYPIGNYRDEDPYYVCARFRNGRHIPLPLLMQPLPEAEFKLQSFVLWLLQLTKRMQHAQDVCYGYLQEYSN